MRRSLLLVLAPLLACAQISSSTEVRVVARAGASPQSFGDPGGHVVSTAFRATWKQQLDELHVLIVEERTCARQVHEPVVRIAEITRKPDGAIYWEYGLGGLLTAVGVVGMAAPQWISSSGVNAEGEVVKDVRSGYRLGGIMGSIGLLLLATGIYDSIRSRDEVIYTDAYRAVDGEPVPCTEPAAPLAGQVVELVVGEHRARGRTDDAGAVALRLPVEPPPVAGMPTQTLRGAIRLGPQRALAIDFVAPYAGTVAREHRGSVSVDAP